MGGCKCSYRSCTVKSDGQTHMFHYPVFDKVRCHQWLTNAQRLDFLDLKVSQLKNRVVCQHHFLANNFMNYKMDKLRYDAVPTENGPFCDTTELVSGKDLMSETAKMFAITTEDIEVDPALGEKKFKKASLSVKYGEFLINSESDPLNSLPISKDKLPYSKSMVKIERKIGIDDSNSDLQSLSFGPVNRISLPPEPNKHQTQPMLVVPPYFDYDNKIAYENAVEVRDSSFVRDLKPVISDINTPLRNSQRNSKIKIISEKKIAEPFKLKGELKPVPTTMVLCGRNTKENVVQNERVNMNNIENMEVIISNPPESSYTIFGSQVSQEPVVLEPQNMHINNDRIIGENPGESNNPVGSITIINPQDVPCCSSSMPNKPQIEGKEAYKILSEMCAAPNTNNQEEKTSNTPQKVSILKPKIPPERVAKIQEKRKFNKKLRDMIVFCLDDLESPENRNNEGNKLQNIGVTQSQQKSNEELHSDKIGKSIIKPQNKNKTLKQKHTELSKNSSQEDTRKENESLNVTTFLSKEPALPSATEYNIAFLEARLKKMEENLMRKIDQNAKRIYELKHTVVDSPTESKKWKSAVTQTNDDEESHKKHLFQEISRYLTPQSKSLIYEELFLSIYAKDKSKTPSRTSQPSKRRKRR